MATDEKQPILNNVDASAADTLLSAVSSVGENAQVAIIIRNENGEFLIKANVGFQDLDWLLRQAEHAILSASLGGKAPEEETN